jgi:hypothetical protein
LRIFVYSSQVSGYVRLDFRLVDADLVGTLELGCLLTLVSLVLSQSVRVLVPSVATVAPVLPT